MNNIDGAQVLLLNASYEALKVISWKKAFELWFREKVEIVEEYSNIIIKTVKKAFNCPAVVRLKKYRKKKNKSKMVKFNRLNVYARDNFTCCYCGNQPGISNLTKDHVVPKSHGGKTTWENIVTSCKTCNSIKADRTPEEARMKMGFVGYKPDFHNYQKFKLRGKDIPEEWKSYLYSIV